MWKLRWELFGIIKTVIMFAGEMTNDSYLWHSQLQSFQPPPIDQPVEFQLNSKPQL
jgi:hypothetical protein